MELDPPRLIGDPVVIAENVSRSRSNGFLDFSISTNGTLLYSIECPPGERPLLVARPER